MHVVSEAGRSRAVVLVLAAHNGLEITSRFSFLNL